MSWRERYPVTEYGSVRYVAFHLERRLSPARAIRKTAALRASFKREGFGMGTITAFALDNPFMSEDARKVMANVAAKHGKR